MPWSYAIEMRSWKTFQHRHMSAFTRKVAMKCWLLYNLNTPHTLGTTNLLVTIIKTMENLTSGILWGDKNAIGKLLSSIFFKGHSLIQLTLDLIMQYLVER